MQEARQGWLSVVVFLAVIVTIIVGSILVMSSRPEPVSIVLNPPPPTDTPAPTATFTPITVYVTGAVRQPETLVTVPYGSRVQDVIEAAGGLLDNADLVRVNLAAIVRDGDQIHVAELIMSTDAPAATPTHVTTDAPTDMPTDAPTDAPTDSPTDAPTEEASIESSLVNLNTATQADLETLPRIGPALAERILAYRDEIGQFTSVDELNNVSGIGGATLDGLRPLVTLGDGDASALPDGVVRATVPPLATPSGGDTIALNSATQADLETLPGIGPAMAERIIAYRDEIGQFTTIDELDNVSGIGEATLERLRPLLRLD
jgi:competence ComEA-like helix-hairpin-helix protein